MDESELPGRPVAPLRGFQRHASPVLILLGLALAYLPMYLPSVLRRLGLELPIAGSPMAALVWNWAATGLLVGYILSVERRPLASVLITRPTTKDIEWAFYLWGTSMTYSWLIGLIRPQEGNEGIGVITALPLPDVLALVLTTAVTEEVLYRGYPIERITELTGRRWIGAGVSIAIFFGSHLPFFGPEWLLYQGVGAVLGYVLYLWRRNLIASMLMHLLGNLPILVPTALG